MKRNYTDKEITVILKSMTVMVDTREQVWGHVEKALAELKCATERGKLDQGDYTAIVPMSVFGGEYVGIEGYCSLADEVVLERKANLDEIANNFTKDRQRFENEFTRAKALGVKVYLIIENASWTDIWSHNYKSKLTPQSLAASLMSWEARYNLTLVFCKPHETGKLIYGILYYWLRAKLEGGGKL